MVGDPVENDLHAQMVDAVHQRPEIGGGAELGVDARVIGDGVVAAEYPFAVELADRLHRHDPQDVDSETLEPDQMGHERGERAGGRVLTRVDLVDHGMLGPGRVRDLGSRRRRRRGRLLSRERQGDAVGPSETVLRGVLASPGAPAQVGDVVLLVHLAGRAVGRPVERQPAIAGGVGEVATAVAPHSLDGEPHERGPPVGGVPLLARHERGRDEAAGLQEFALQARGRRASLFRRGESEVQRGRGRERRAVGDAGAAAPADVEEEPARGIPGGGEQSTSARFGRGGVPRRYLGVARLTAQASQRGDGPLGMVQQAVEIDGNEVRRFQGQQVFGIPHPARREIPAALCRGLDVTVERVPLTDGKPLTEQVVFTVRLGPRLGPVVPIPVEQGSVGEPYDAAIRRPRSKTLRSVHPERVLRLQRVEIRNRLRAVGRLGVQPDHSGEIRRLAAAEVVGAIAVRDVPDRPDQVGKVVEHAADEVGAPALDEPQHGEVGIPVVDLPEASAGHDVFARQGDQR